MLKLGLMPLLELLEEESYEDQDKESWTQVIERVLNVFTSSLQHKKQTPDHHETLINALIICGILPAVLDLAAARNPPPVRHQVFAVSAVV